MVQVASRLGTETDVRKIEAGVVAMLTVPDGLERIGILPDNLEDLYEFDDELNVIIGDDYTMQTRDTWNED